MRKIEIRDLQEDARAVIADAAAGETILLTDQGRPVAQLSPLTPPTLEHDHESARDEGEGMGEHTAWEAATARMPRRSLRELPAPDPSAGPGLTEALAQMRDDERY